MIEIEDKKFYQEDYPKGNQWTRLWDSLVESREEHEEIVVIECKGNCEGQ